MLATKAAKSPNASLPRFWLTQTNNTYILPRSISQMAIFCSIGTDKTTIVYSFRYESVDLVSCVNTGHFLTETWRSGVCRPFRYLTFPHLSELPFWLWSLNQENEVWTRRTRIVDDHRKRDPWRNLFKLWDSWQLSDRYFYAIIYVLLFIVELNRHISFITVKRWIWTDNRILLFLIRDCAQFFTASVHSEGRFKKLKWFIA